MVAKGINCGRIRLISESAFRLPPTLTYLLPFPLFIPTELQSPVLGALSLVTMKQHANIPFPSRSEHGVVSLVSPSFPLSPPPPGPCSRRHLQACALRAFAKSYCRPETLALRPLHCLTARPSPHRMHHETPTADPTTALLAGLATEGLSPVHRRSVECTMNLTAGGQRR